jgi:hypothetical protein
MNEITKQLFARIYLEKITSDNFVDWAIDCLEEGLDTKNLRMLVASEKPYYSNDIELRFNKALNELGWKKPTQDESLLSLAKEFANKILKEIISPTEGLREIYLISIELNHPQELRNWFWLDEGHDPETNEWIYDTWGYSTGKKENWIEAIKREAKKLSETVFIEKVENKLPKS